MKVNIINGVPKNPDGINTGNPLERTYCPVHVSKLKFLYEQGMSAKDIGETLRKLMGREKPISGFIVWSWMKAAGVRMRPLTLAIAIRHKNGGNNSYLSENMSKARAVAHANAKSERRRKIAVQNLRAGIKKWRAEHHVRVRCCRPLCSVTFKARKSWVAARGFHYCSNECQVEDKERRLRERAMVRRITKMEQSAPHTAPYVIPQHLQGLAAHLGITPEQMSAQ